MSSPPRSRKRVESIAGSLVRPKRNMIVDLWSDLLCFAREDGNYRVSMNKRNFRHLEDHCIIIEEHELDKRAVKVFTTSDMKTGWTWRSWLMVIA